MTLAPELEPPRARVDRRVLVLCGAAAIAFAASAVIALRGTPPARVPVIVPQLRPIVIAASAPAPAPPPAPLDDRDHVDDDLTAFVHAWLTDPRAPTPAIEYRRGVVYIESAEDRGDDPPYPRSADAEAQRVCGSAAVWLRSYLRERLAYADLACRGAVCTYPGMEYAPSGEFVFRRIELDREPTWALVSWTQTYTAALGADDAKANTDFVARARARLATTSCPGEPDGAY